MFSFVLFYLVAIILAFVPALCAHAIPRPLPPLHSIASRGSPRQIDAFLDAHNTVRALHNATDLTWSNALATRAEFWADHCEFKHTNGQLSNQLYGENIVAGTGNFSITAAVATFVQDQDKYDPANPSFLHFTQVVWKSTTELGCAVSQCDGIFDPLLGKASLYVCLYNPVGNVVGQAT
ncbi:CAP domain-containing protein [Crassisporium funariophilum]|nr:CAP domain-containing protein [Crassisporium funariophilum]